MKTDTPIESATLLDGTLFITTAGGGLTADGSRWLVYPDQKQSLLACGIATITAQFGGDEPAEEIGPNDQGLDPDAVIGGATRHPVIVRLARELAADRLLPGPQRID